MGAGEGRPVLVVGDVTIDPGSRTATRSGRDLALTRSEFELLAHLAETPGRVVPSRELLSRIWGQEWVGDDTSLETHVSRLRRKLGESAAEPGLIRTIRGVGYMLAEVPGEPAEQTASRPRRRWVILAAAGAAAGLAVLGLLALQRGEPAACAPGYEPCLPVSDDLNCSQIKQQVTVTGDDPYGLDRDGDGLGCQLYAP